jgi:hypothetical protein
MHQNRDDLVVEDGTMTVPIREHAPLADTPPAEPEMPFDPEGDRRPSDGENDPAWSGFDEPAAKTGPDVTQRCAPEGIDPGDERYVGELVEVDYDTGAVVPSAER